MPKRLLLIAMLMLALVACGADTTSTQAPAITATTDDIYAALPQSMTTDGYYVLGRADAPITINHYSDFL